MDPQIDHIQITVKNLEKAESFYDQLLPILGFDLSSKSKGKVDAHEFEVIEYAHKNMILGFNSPRSIFKDEVVHRRKPGSLHHLAFKAGSKNEVDEVYDSIKSIPTTEILTPQYYPQHGENYYALFLKDPDGIKLEVVFEPR